MNDCAYRGSAAPDLFATIFAAAGREMSKEAKREVLKELGGEREELDGEIEEAELRQRGFPWTDRRGFARVGA